MLKCEVASTPEDICEKRLLICKQLRRCSVKLHPERIVLCHSTPQKRSLSVCFNENFP